MKENNKEYKILKNIKTNNGLLDINITRNRHYSSDRIIVFSIFLTDSNEIVNKDGLRYSETIVQFIIPIDNTNIIDEYIDMECAKASDILQAFILKYFSYENKNEHLNQENIYKNLQRILDKEYFNINRSLNPFCPASYDNR